MKLFGFDISRLKATPEPQGSVGDVANIPMRDDSIFKAYIPGYLYKPPFGYPRKENLPLIRNLALNPYIFSVVKTLQDEAASTEYDIVYKEGVEPTPAMDIIIEEIKNFFDNPNQNRESWGQIRRKLVRDICEVDSAVINKIYNRAGAMTQIFAYDGASFLKNPDIHGYMGDRVDFVFPDMTIYGGDKPSKDQIVNYSQNFKEEAAYFQYGFTGNALPVPFGKREIVYIMQNPRTDSIYGQSPIAILADIITSLVYGANYNLDFYMNNNMPEGALEILGANKDQVRRTREMLSNRVTAIDQLFGRKRKIAFKIPVVNQPIKFVPFNLDPKIMQILEQQSWFTKLVWACFGVTADEMGFTEDSNKAVSQVQHSVYKRKAVRPILNLLKYHIDKEIIPEWGEEAFKNLEYRWDDYDMDEDLKKHNLLQQELNMGIKTPEMVAEELGIDFTDVKIYNEEQEAKEMELMDKSQQDNPLDKKEDKKENPKKKAHNKKDIENTDLEKKLTKRIETRGKKLIKALEQIDKGDLKNI